MRGIQLFVILCAVLIGAPAFAQSISFISQPAEVGSGLQSNNVRARLSDSQHGGILVSLSASDSTQALVAPDDQTPGVPEVSVFVPNGSTDAFFVVQALPDTTGTVTIEAQAPGFATNSFNVDVVTPAFDLTGVTATRSVIDPEDPFTVRVGIASGTGVSVGTTQKARVGGAGFTATITSSVPATLMLRTQTQTGGSVTVLIPPGSSSSAASIASGGVAADALQPGTAQISGSIDGFDTVDNSARTVTYEAAVIDFLGLPQTIGAGLRGNLLRARLNGSAHGGTTIDIVSEDPSRVLLSQGSSDPGVPSLSILVNDGSTDASFYAHALEGVTGIATVSASAAGIIGDTDGVTVVAPNFRLNSVTTTIDTLDPPDAFTVQVGYSLNGTSWSASQPARPGGPGIDGVAYVVDPAVGQIVDAIASGDSINFRLEPGDSSTPGSIAGGGVGFDGVGAGSTTVSAAIAGFTPTTQGFRDVTVTQPTISWVGTTSDLGSGLQSLALRARLSAAGHGGVTVTITGDNPLLGLIAANDTDIGSTSVDVFVPDGSIDAFFYVNALEGQTGILTLTASTPGFVTTNTPFDIVDPRIEIQSLTSSTTTLALPDPFRARIGWLAGSNFHVQPLRPGSAGLTITFDVDDPGVGQIQTSSTTATSVQLTLVAGQSDTPSTVASGGVAFVPVGVGIANVTASAPGFVPGANGTRTVTVSAPNITLFGTTTDVGSGLQSGGVYAQLDASEHGGVTVRVESDDPTALLIAPDAVTQGAAFQDILVPNGQARANFHLQAIDGMSGSIQIDATSPGFASDTEFVDVVQPGVEIEFLSPSAGVSDPDDPFRVRVGVPNSIGSSLSYQQVRRAGAPPLVVQLESSNVTVGELVTLAQTGPMVQLSIAAGEDDTPSTVGAGGVAFRPIGGGTTFVSAFVDGFFPTGDATREVQVAVDGIALVSVPAQVGAGLTGGPVLARLGNASHGGTTVTITSADTARLRVAPDLMSPGSETIDVFVANGQTDASFFVLGTAGVTGSVDVSAAAPGFNTNARSTEIVAPALQIVDLPDSVNVNAPDLPFRVQVGIPDAGGVGLAQLQVVHSDAAPLAVSVGVAGAGLGRLEVLGAESDSVMVEIPPGVAETGATIATGGIVLDPVASGAVTIGASAPGTVPVLSSTATILFTGTVVAVGDVPALAFGLREAYPNPFNPQTTLSFSLGHQQFVSLKVVDVAGRVVRTLVSQKLDAGLHRAVWDGRDARGARVASGVYLSVLRGDEDTLSRKMVLVK